MGLITINPESDGTSADANDLNSRFAIVTGVINGNIDSANIASGGVTAANLAAGAVTSDKIGDGAVTNAKLNTAAGEPGGTWNAYVPTWTNVTTGNGTTSAFYKQVGKTVFFRLSFTLGTTSSVGAGQVSVSLPVTSATLTARDLIAQGDAFDTSGGQPYSIRALWVNATTIQAWVDVANATFVNQSALNSSQPMTWATGDMLQLTGFYEAA